MTRWRKGGLLGAVVVLAGGVLLAASLFTPWYAFHRDATVYPSGSPFYTDTRYYLGLPSWDGTVQYSCNYSPCLGETSYSSLSLNGTGVTAEISLFLISAATLLGLVPGAFGIVYRRNERRTFTAMVLAIAALVVAIFATAFYAVAIQLSLAQPWNSFWGSTSGFDSAGPWTVSWGPATGWYLSIAAIAALLVGAVLLVRFRHDVAESVPSTASAGPTDEANTRNSTT